MALEGTFEDMTLVDLFQIFRTGGKSGVLVLSGGAERGLVYVLQGRLIDAVVVRGPERRVLASGEEAVLCLLQWEEASFTFRHDLAVQQHSVRIIHDSEWLILEGVRRRTTPLSSHHPPITAETRLALSALPASAESGVNLNLDQWRILSQIAVCQQLHEICRNTGIALDQAVHTVSELVAIGLVDVLPPPRPVAAPVPATLPVAEAANNSLTPALAGVGAIGGNGRGLLSVIMRKIRGL